MEGEEAREILLGDLAGHRGIKRKRKSGMDSESLPLDTQRDHRTLTHPTQYTKIGSPLLAGRKATRSKLSLA
jgi:hypothetical protein